MMAKAFRLSPMQWEMFDSLARRIEVTKVALRHACYGDRLDCDVPRSAGKAIDVQFHHLRRRAAAIGITIESRKTIDTGRGGRTARYFMPPESRRKARALIAARATVEATA